MKNEPHIQDLLDRISGNGDEGAFKNLFNAYVDSLLRFAVSILKCKELAEETVSDVFFKIWLHREKINRIDNFKAYLFTTTRNVALNYLDKEKRERARRLEDIHVPVFIDEICPESELITKELREAIGIAIDHLPERCKLIYSLAKIDRLKYKEIAQILNISVKTIDHQLTIAIKKIGEEIQQHLNDQGAPEKFPVLFHLFLPSGR